MSRPVLYIFVQVLHWYAVGIAAAGFVIYLYLLKYFNQVTDGFSGIMDLAFFELA